MQSSDSDLKGRLAAAELRATRAEQRLERTLDELDSVTSMVNHDLRSPLVSVMGFAAELHLLTEEALGHCGDSPEQRRLAAELAEAFDFLDGGAKKMARLLDAFSAIGALRRRMPAREPVDMQALFEQLGVGVRERLSGGRLELGNLPTITGDRPALAEMFGYLLDNAVQFVRPGVPGVVEVRADTQGDLVLFFVKDNGRGLLASDFKRVFRPFVRVMPQDDMHEGLGLARALAIARRLDGNIDLESTLGEGTTFRVSLPA